jgi:hypothetical protein
MIPLINPKMPSTAIPSIRKGIEITQKIGYSIKAKIAIGQQRIKSIIQPMNVNIN